MELSTKKKSTNVMKLEQLIPSGIKDAMMVVTSKPKRRRMKATLINSTEEHRSAV